jgi:hypothetical protein
MDFTWLRATVSLLPILFVICSDRDYAIWSDSWPRFSVLAIGALQSVECRRR